MSGLVRKLHAVGGHAAGEYCEGEGYGTMANPKLKKELVLLLKYQVRFYQIKARLAYMESINDLRKIRGESPAYIEKLSDLATECALLADRVEALEDGMEKPSKVEGPMVMTSGGIFKESELTSGSEGGKPDGE